MEPENNQNSSIYGNIQAPLAQPMVATPVDFALGNQLDMANREVHDGRSTDMHAQTEHAIEQATRLADMMASQGHTDDEIKRAVGNIPGVNSDNHAAIQAAAMNTADAHKFSILGGAAKNDAPAPTLGKLVLNDNERPLDENGKILSTTATLAALEQFRPQAGLPIPQREQGLQRG